MSARLNMSFRGRPGPRRIILIPALPKEVENKEECDGDVLGLGAVGLGVGVVRGGLRGISTIVILRLLRMLLPLPRIMRPRGEPVAGVVAADADAELVRSVSSALGVLTETSSDSTDVVSNISWSSSVE